ncbi:DUF1398 domain-containing protein [Parafilimonas sp.]|uniref:DUF1398 domain-containing protein n=1 Tax=Parafilimonas sp. TaxID=1969739 RepID=UPI003F7F4211
MFTIEQINTVHSKVKSGADFPAYIQDLKKMRVLAYETFVSDGHTVYYGDNNFQMASPAKYAMLLVAGTANTEEFKTQLAAHQQGKTDYPTFCKDCATSGVAKWKVVISEMSCIYYDKAGNKILAEQIPG